MPAIKKVTYQDLGNPGHDSIRYILDDLGLDRSGHPANQLRAAPDEMLTVVEARFYPDGHAPAPASLDLSLDRVALILEHAGSYLGYGFHASLTITPDTPTMTDALETARRLNEMEATVPVALIGGGAWCTNPEVGTLTYAWFHPNGGLLRQLAMLMYGIQFTQRGTSPRRRRRDSAVVANTSTENPIQLS